MGAQSSRFAPAPVPVAAARPPARAAPPVAFAPARPYSFGYEVVDAEAGNAYGHREGTDDGVTKGEFRVVLPDTRTQIVRYTVSAETGYVAEVSYEGTPVYPQHQNPRNLLL